MMKTKLTELLGIEYPIVQSGMQWLAVPQLAAAVCNAGGIGTINVTCWPTLDEFADALDEMNSLDGNVDSAIFCAGMGMGLVHDVVPVKVLLDRMVKEAEETVNSLKMAF